MTKKPSKRENDDKRKMDEVLRKMLKTPPDPNPDKSKSDKKEKPAK